MTSHSAAAALTLAVTTRDGLTLRAYDYPNPDKPSVILVHGYPDNASVWADVVEALRTQYRVVTYDVRGAGASDKPEDTRAYQLDQLAADLDAVIAVVSPERPVHVVGHDWGSIQVWHALTRPDSPRQIASFTSISGPSLDYAASWYARESLLDLRALWPRIYQALSSTYIGVFLTPFVSEQLWRSGLLARTLGALGPTGTLSDQLYGLKLYRANIPRSLRHPVTPPQPTQVPVQVLAPRHDRYVTVALQAEAPRPWTAQLSVHTLDGGHWVVRTHAAAIASHIEAFIERVQTQAPRPASV